MVAAEHLKLEDMERRVCDVAAKQLGFSREQISPGLRIVEDLDVDSLDLVELFMEIEQALDITLPDEAPNQHIKGATYLVQTLPMAAVNELLGMSPFGLHHMAGNVRQWCRDWYDENFYCRAEASLPNPLNQTPGNVRSERGGSWIGPSSLCRSSYRRGSPPTARGPCLGFRCVSKRP